MSKRTTHPREVHTPDIELVLPARAENIAVVRHAFGALGDALDIDAQTLADIRLAVTEACTNVVIHAYPGDREGPLEVHADVVGSRLTIVVLDEGAGIVPRADSPGLGLGLPLIASLSEALQLRRDERQRTEVCMTFSLDGGQGTANGLTAPDASPPDPPPPDAPA